ncbi:HD family phosphohydrolase [cyanobiont of Ornithocercus magnificus]|nr:HD family phosphohydrolase [cyanobiont of Ornithocercus magnificus]
MASRVKKLWRNWIRAESFHCVAFCWAVLPKTTLLFTCVVVAVVFSWPWLVGTNLKPGLLAPFNTYAPRSASVVNSEALEQQQSKLRLHSSLQFVDTRETTRLKQKLEQQLVQLEQISYGKSNDYAKTENLSTAEEKWLSSRTPEEQLIWSIILHSAVDRILNQGLVGTLTAEQLRRAASSQLTDLGRINSPARTLGSRLLANVFQGASNLCIDLACSQEKLEELVDKQGIPVIEILKGDLITYKGEYISRQAYDLLDYFELVSWQPQFSLWLPHFLEAFAGCGVLLLLMRWEYPYLEVRHGLLALGLLLMTQSARLWFETAINPLAMIVPPTLLLAQSIGVASGLAWMSVAGLLWPIPAGGFGEERLMVACAIAAISALQARHMRSRTQLLQLMMMLPLGALVTERLLLHNQFNTNIWSQLASRAWELSSEALFTATMLMLATLAIPVLESFFGLLSRARLMELADQERPLLRRLSSEAPGTFEHTLMICGLAEEAARVVGGDIDLIRAGALYHDIGKLYAPGWFIENQSNGVNPHDILDDPEASASILQAHVDEGLRLARRHRLPQPVASFIPEHQGTLKMGYFLHQAQKLNPLVEENRFRYRGPVPRSRETAILMLADGCEAALRSQPPNTSDAEACQIVRRIIDARHRDGQLHESDLSELETELMVRAFVRVWRRTRHRRIPYPVATQPGLQA